MTPWPDGSDLDSVEIMRRCKNNNALCLAHDSPIDVVLGDSKFRLRTLFDQVLSCFSREISGRKCIHNIPAMFSNGQTADLFKLFWIVRKLGGYDLVSRNGFWGFVANECGLSFGVSASVKLIHYKHLRNLDQLLNEVSVNEVIEKLDLLLLELNESKDRLLRCKHRKKSVSRKRLSSCSNLDICTSELHFLEGESSASSKRSIFDDDKKNYLQVDNGIALLPKSVVDKVINPKKKKRVGILSSSEVVNWVIHMAKYHHDDVASGKVPECTKWKEYGNNELWGQVLSAQEELVTRHFLDSVREESQLQKKSRTHPPMYGDNDVQIKNDSPGRLIKRFCTTKSQFSPTTTSHEKKSSGNDTSKKSPVRRQVCVGPDSQAEVPNWFGPVAVDSESKWVTTQMWTPEEPVLEADPIGKGRPDSCKCYLAGSAECVRFHIAENRLRLKKELGCALFLRWGFGQMGEEVALSWNIYEQKRFKEMTINHNLVNKFWARAFKLFPGRTRENLVSFYFNVLVLRRRQYQNRVTPDNIDSDDDETEFGSIGDNFGYHGDKIRESRFLACSQSTQCFDFDE